MLALQNTKKKPVQFSALYFMALSINAVILFLLVLLMKTHQLKVGWFEDATRDHIAANTIYVIIITSIFTLLIFLKARWYWTVSVLLLYIVIDHFLIWIGVLKIADWWSVYYFTILNLFDILLVYFLHHYLIYYYYRYT